MLLAAVLLALASSAAAALPAAAAGWVNVQARRQLDVRKQYLVTSVSVKAKPAGSSSSSSSKQAPYLIAFTADEARRLAVLNVTVEDAPLQARLAADAPAGFVHYAVDLPAAGSEELSFKVVAGFVDALQPLPAQVKQSESQYMQLSASGYWLSPYATEKQSATVLLPPGLLRSFSQPAALAPAEHEVGKRRVRYGPYSAPAAVGAYAGAEPGAPAIAVHYEQNGAMALLDSAVREIEISQWGNVAVEEIFDLRHTGAALLGGFSRVDYQMKNAKSGSFNSLLAKLPAGASDVYYRDVIGNISSSHLRSSRSGVELELETRFPLFGGWKTEWYQGYNLPASAAVSRQAAAEAGSAGGQQLVLRLPAQVPFADMPVRDFKLKVILPEAAQLLDVQAPFPFELQRTRRFTYLDSPLFGREVAVLQALGPVISSASPGDVVVTFRMPAMSWLYKPVFLITSFLAAFLLFAVAIRIDLSLGGSSASKRKSA